MAKQLAIRTSGATGDSYIYVEDSAGQSLSLGSDGATNVFCINMSTAAAVSPVEATAVLAIQPTTGDIVLQAEPGTGTLTVTVADSTFTTGDVNITAGNLNMPTSANNATAGVITFGDGSKISFPSAQNIYIGYQTGTYPNVVNIANNVAIGETCMSQTTATTRCIDNVAIGISSLNGVMSDTSGNVAIGSSAISQLQIGDNNVGISTGALTLATGGSSNVAVGSGSLGSLLTGSLNVALGASAGSSYIGAESSNIVIGNSGTAAESNVIRIGTQGSGAGQQNAAYIAGIASTTVSNKNYVTINTSTGQLGSDVGPTSVNSPVSFSAYASATINNVTGDGTSYHAVFDTALFNNGGGYATGTGTFTAPIAGYYQFNATLGAANLGAGHTLGQTHIATTARNYISCYDNYYAASSGGIYMSSQSRLAYLNAGDTAYAALGVYNSTKTVGLYGGAVNSSFSGYLVQATSSAVTFSAYRSADVANVTGDGTAYMVPYNVSLVNVGSGFNTGTGVFTAPNTGRYMFNVTVGLSTLGAGHTLGTMQLVTTGGTYTSNYAAYGPIRASNNLYMQTFSQLVSMTAGDTAYVVVTVSNSTKTVTLYGAAGNSSFSGYQI